MKRIQVKLKNEFLYLKRDIDGAILSFFYSNEGIKYEKDVIFSKDDKKVNLTINQKRV